MNLRKRQDYQLVAQLHADEEKGNDFLSSVFIMNKSPTNSEAHQKTRPKFTSNWYVKAVKLADRAIVETIFQEFLRFFLAHHPKTRYVPGDGENQHHVASKGVSIELISEMIKSSNVDTIRAELPNYRGWGFIHVLALWAAENDLRPGNLGLDKLTHQVIKIDSGQTLCELFSEQVSADQFIITTRDLENLPYIQDFQPTQWMGIPKEQRHIVNLLPESYVQSDEYKKEVLSAILQIICLGEHLMTLFLNHYLSMINCPDETREGLKEVILNRTMMLRDAAIQMPSFRTFLFSADAESAMYDLTQKAKHFVMTQKHLLIQETDNKPFTQSFQTLYALRKQAFTIDMSSHKNIFTRYGKGKAIGASTGMITTAGLAAVAFLALRLVDFATFGLSTVITIPLSIGLCGIIGGCAGAFIGRKVQKSQMINNKIANTQLAHLLKNNTAPVTISEPLTKILARKQQLQSQCQKNPTKNKRKLAKLRYCQRMETYLSHNNTVQAAHQSVMQEMSNAGEYQNVIAGGSWLGSHQQVSLMQEIGLSNQEIGNVTLTGSTKKRFGLFDRTSTVSLNNKPALDSRRFNAA